jgi:hypothetical protein
MADDLEEADPTEVEDDDDDEDDAPETAMAQAIPGRDSVGADSDDEPVNISAEDPSGAGSLIRSAQNAYLDGQQYGIRHARLSTGALRDPRLAARDPEMRKRGDALLKGAWRYTPEEMRAMGDKVDPKHELSPTVRNLMVYGGLYEFHMNRGQPEVAAQAAFRMSQAFQHEYNMQMAQAEQKAREGDMRGTIHHILRADENTPNGVSTRAVMNKSGGVSVVQFDLETGKKIRQADLTPEQILTLAKSGNLQKLPWHGVMAERAKGGAEPSEAFTAAQKALDDGKPDQIKWQGMKPNEVTTIRNLMKQTATKEPAPKNDPREARSMNHAASEISAYNREMTKEPSDANPPEPMGKAGEQKTINKWREHEGLPPREFAEPPTPTPRENPFPRERPFLDWFKSKPAESPPAQPKFDPAQPYTPGPPEATAKPAALAGNPAGNAPTKKPPPVGFVVQMKDGSFMKMTPNGWAPSQRPAP